MAQQELTTDKTLNQRISFASNEKATKINARFPKTSYQFTVDSRENKKKEEAEASSYFKS